ncbi:fungal-specific transcription factor domain-containing protein [Schizophyllum amplum]|uniref:Fungal-specific transcription factor domain-containing protein n=1 Tax=Schizophyllum amplum TaxID=97359 RepID=A0A550CCU1_9AGAR|nr:fungal-specific transcription factor domain-containing protein [Auriculariopsis ampla]
MADGQARIAVVAESAPLSKPPKRRYGASCEACRRRKRRCDGKGANGVSLCKYCPQAGIACVFPPRSGEASRMGRAYSELETCRDLLYGLARASDDDRERMLSKWITRQEENGMSSSRGSGSDRPYKRPRRDSISSILSTTDDRFADHNHRPVLPSIDNEYDRTLSRLIDFACAGSANLSPPQPDQARLMLESYFCWQNPRYMILSRPILEMSMQTNNEQFCSEFLLCTMYAVASRHLPELQSRTDDFSIKAHILLSAELCKPSSFATAQGLILLAANLATQGSYSQSWNITGLAVRLFGDLGCTADMVTSQDMDAAEALSRQRVYWTAYVWDKALSLAMSRKPTLRTKIPPPDFSVQDDPSRLWKPYYSPYQMTTQRVCLPRVPPPSNEMTTFYHVCLAYQFLDEIIEEIYEHRERRPLQTRSFVLDIRDRIIAWQGSVPPDILLDTEEIPNLPVPPPHVIEFNLLVHTTWILLYRPFLSEEDSATAIPHSMTACRKSATDIHYLLRLYESTYPLSRIFYLIIYAAFCSATIDMDLITDEDATVAAAARSRLELTLRVLAVGCKYDLPGIQKSVVALRNQLDKYGTPEEKPRVKPESSNSTDLTLDIAAADLADLAYDPSTATFSVSPTDGEFVFGGSPFLGGSPIFGSNLDWNRLLSEHCLSKESGDLDSLPNWPAEAGMNFF